MKTNKKVKNMGEDNSGKKPYEKPKLERQAIFEPPLGYLGLGGKGQYLSQKNKEKK